MPTLSHALTNQRQTLSGTGTEDRVWAFTEGWLVGTNPNKLLYEDTWGGLHDEEYDFGNGMYNDHHFQYGYHIYTAAVLARADPAWGEKWNERSDMK